MKRLPDKYTKNIISKSSFLEKKQDYHKITLFNLKNKKNYYTDNEPKDTPLCFTSLFCLGAVLGLNQS